MDKTYTNRLFVWSLATFHTSFFFAIAILLLYWTGILGSLLSSLNTLIGFALFGVFWLVTTWTTRRALKSISGGDFKKILARPLELSKIFGYSVLWGGVNSLLFFLIVLIAFILIFTVEILQGTNTLNLPYFIAYAGIVGSLVAFLAGAFFGMVFAILDSAILGIVGLAFPG